MVCAVTLLCMITALLLFMQLSHAAPIESANYQRPCYLDEDDALSTHLAIDNNKWTITHTAYEDEACSEEYLIFETQYKALQSGNDLDMTVIETSYISLTGEVTEALNLVGYCGFFDWKTKEKKVVSESVCGDYIPPQLGEVLYTYYKTGTNSQGQEELYLGESWAEFNGKSPDQRHQRLQKRSFYKY